MTSTEHVIAVFKESDKKIKESCKKKCRGSNALNEIKEIANLNAVISRSFFVIYHTLLSQFRYCKYSFEKLEANTVCKSVIDCLTLYCILDI